MYTDCDFVQSWSLILHLITQGHGFHVFLQFMTREEAWEKAFDITSI